MKWLLLLSSVCFADPFQQGADMASLANETAFQKAEEVVNSLPSQGLDPEIAREQVLSSEIPRSRVVDFLQSEEVRRNEKENRGFHENENFFERSEEITAQAENLPDTKEELDSYIEHCLIADAPCEEAFERSLSVKVTHDSEVVKETRRCRGHSMVVECSSKKLAKQEIERQKIALSINSTIYSSSVSRDGKNVKVHWTHHDNCQNCNCYVTSRQVLQDEKYHEEDQWICDEKHFLKLLKNPNCTLISKECLDDTPTKQIDGRDVTRPCWREKFLFACASTCESSTKPCSFLNRVDCKLLSKECVERGPYGCTLWDYTFRCYNQSPKIESVSYESSSSESQSSLPEVATKLAIFCDMKKQIESSGAYDPSKITFFAGEVFKCSRNIAKNIFYDCCSTYDGLAVDLKLTHCNNEELSLKEKRRLGLCHYVGSYSEEFLDLWKSRDIHHFCCFPSKLARVFQEGAHEQLLLDWGDPKQPDCRGLFQTEISKVNFSSLDLREIYDMPKSFSEDLEDKMRFFKERVQQRLECIDAV